MSKMGPVSLLMLAATLLTTREARAENFLPNWFDPSQETADGRPPLLQTPLFVPDDFRVPAEYEPIAAVTLGWTGSVSFLGEIAGVIGRDTKAAVWAVNGPTSIKDVPRDRYLQANCPIDTLWIRDYGPVGLRESTGAPGVLDSVYRHYQSRRADDAVPTCLADAASVAAYGVDLILDGGNLLLDSAGNLFTTERTYIWNKKYSRDEVDSILKRNYGAKNINILPYAGFPGNPADGTGHIDMFVKLLSDNVVLISEAKKEPFASAVNAAVKFFKSRKAPDGEPYTILRVPGWQSSETWYTYTNSLLVNGIALIPAYADYPAENETARKVYERAGFTVRPIVSDATIRQGGSIHCVTQTIPAAAN
jgi:agmatine/peptidylarginine deiminase